MKNSIKQRVFAILLAGLLVMDLFSPAGVKAASNESSAVLVEDTELFAAAISIANATVTLPKAEYGYTGKAITPTVTVVVDGVTLVKDTDYTVSYSNNKEESILLPAVVTVTGKGNYTGTARATFRIVKKSLSDKECTVTLSKTSYTYNGGANKPNATVVYDGVTLKKDTDYTINYLNNTNAGTATAIITGKGSYGGIVTKTFTIKEFALSKATITIASNVYYDGKAKVPEVTVKNGSKKLTKDTDYTLTYANNINIGTAKVTITGKGSCSGTVTKTFKIGVKKGASYTVGNYVYNITSASQVAFAGISKQTLTSVKIPKTVKIGGKTFGVTSVANKALYKNKKVKTITVGANVKTIGQNAFAECTALTKVTVGTGVTQIKAKAFMNSKKLKTITINTKNLKKVGSNALKGIHEKAKIKVPKAKLNAYRNLLKNKGQGKKVTIVK